MVEFPVDFFRDEVRCGFYIPTAVKQAWAAELAVLSEIDRICVKHGIRYFADWGSILGAVRHGGFVPWDDDLDICMLRDDYAHFRQVADAELPKEYVIHDYERQEDHWLFLARIVNHDKICFTPEYLNSYHNFPWLAGVDIFVKDYLYADEKKEKERDDEVLHILTVADGIVEGSLRPEVKEEWLCRFEQKYAITIDRKQTARQMGITLYRLAEQQMARVAPEETDTIGQIFPFILKGGKGQRKAYYEQILRLPFENVTIPVSASYDAILRSRYGDYLQIRKVWGGHNYPFFEGQKAELQSHADFALPAYHFDRGVLQEHRICDVPKRRRVLFLAAGPMWWKSLAGLYEKERTDLDAEVCVVALPMLFKDCYGEIRATDEELAMAAREEEYPEDVMLTPWYEFDIEQYKPDRIYFQDVYDGENPVLSVPEVFNAANVRQSAKELVLVPPLYADDFTPEDRNDVYGTRHYVTAPGVVYADRVLVHSECIRERYLDALMDWAGDDTKQYWEEKVRLRVEWEKDAFGQSEQNTVKTQDGEVEAKEASSIATNGETRTETPKKNILFMIGANELAEHGEQAAAFLRKKLDILKENNGALDVTFCLYPPDLADWEESLGASVEPFVQEIEAALEWGGLCDLRENSAEEIVEACDAYYGSPSPLVVEFVRAKKPVMIADYRV
ncbi:MAG: LicD family protein [Lachnospiraceae bacterium]|nr:LicD family protein [Lachnospiraceae bacterium]